MDALAPLLQAAVAVLLLHAALHDLAARTVPNRTSAALGCAGAGLRLIGGDLAAGLLLALLVLAGAAALWLRGWLGGGDVKLLAALALAVPPAQVAPMLAAVALAGGAVACAHLLLRRVVRLPRTRRAGLVARAWRAEAWRILRRGPLPYAVAIAGGGLFTLFG